MKKENKNTLKKKISIKKTFCTGLVLILVAGLMIVSIELYKEKNKQITLEDIQSLQQGEINKILDEISKHMMLPSDEIPTVATITDVDNLRKQMPFFNKAQNGFKVVVYSQKAILFDPINDIIVDVAPVVQGANTKQQEQNKKQNEEKQDSEKTKNKQEENMDKEESEVIDAEKNKKESVDKEEGEKVTENTTEDSDETTNTVDDSEK